MPWGSAYNLATQNNIVAYFRRNNILTFGLVPVSATACSTAPVADLPRCVIITVGGILGFLGGERRTAPRWLGRLGLEWVFRVATEPRRLRRVIDAEDQERSAARRDQRQQPLLQRIAEFVGAPAGEEKPRRDGPVTVGPTRSLGCCALGGAFPKSSTPRRYSLDVRSGCRATVGIARGRAAHPASRPANTRTFLRNMAQPPSS